MWHGFRIGTVGTPRSTPKRPGGTVGGILRIAELDLDALELGWVRSVRVSEKTCRAIRETAAQHDVALSVHAPYFINLNANDEEWPRSKKRLLDAAVYGALAGATDIVFHPGSYFGAEPKEVLPVALRRLEEVIQELEARGVQVRLRPETMGKPAMLGSLEDVLEMSRAFPQWVEPCLDFAHLHARAGDGSMNTYEEWARVLEAYGKALGDADLDLDAILRVLRDFGAQGRILVESPTLEDDALILKNRWLALHRESVR